MKRGGRSLVRGVAITLLAFAVLFGGAYVLLDRIGAASDAAQAELVRDAVRSALVTCYAVEGAYPGDVTYLKENYGLAYDEDRFLVYYDAFASNILPEVRVHAKGAVAG